ncbi:3'-5' exonuclease [Phenylobacterium sp.]|uniref:3'-5' exonuclease n=1 Tax=Phenylobacterium sp. TaxID=1871053 RepID=UPI00273086A7|nr:3'-5' exonuclease [Phenylobacterium sp.]MDP1873608.1 3'-5' exonuclease [Phenylobacterium sp.]
MAAPNPTHVMLDLETMGSSPGSAIVAIGAVAFDPVSSLEGETFYRVIDLASSVRAGLTMDADTVIWWLKQSPLARHALTGPAEPLDAALASFSAYWRRVGGTHLWGHGGGFDEPLLDAAYRAGGQKTPWRYSQARCTRTIFEIAGVQPDRSQGTHHNALDDARAQAEAVCLAYSVIRIDAKATAPADAAPTVTGA